MWIENAGEDRIPKDRIDRGRLVRSLRYGELGRPGYVHRVLLIGGLPAAAEARPVPDEDRPGGWHPPTVAAWPWGATRVARAPRSSLSRGPVSSGFRPAAFGQL